MTKPLDSRPAVAGRSFLAPFMAVLELNEPQPAGGRMKVKRIVSNIATASPSEAEKFYSAIFGLQVVMDHGWIRTYSSGEEMTAQVSVASEGGSGTPVPDLSIEVDNLEVALERARKENIKVEYGPVTEPWGVRRFYIRDPFGKLINVLQHE